MLVKVEGTGNGFESELLTDRVLEKVSRGQQTASGRVVKLLSFCGREE